MVASSSRWNPYWLLVALCSATRERADRMRAPVSVAIILLQTAASRINSLFASLARQCYIVHPVEHHRNHRDARITRGPGVKATVTADKDPLSHGAHPPNSSASRSSPPAPGGSDRVQRTAARCGPLIPFPVPGGRRGSP